MKKYTSLSLSRRHLLRLTGSLLPAVARPRFASAFYGDGLKQQSGPLSFPSRFLWGAATSAYQVEGAANEDGRGPSIWDTFSHTSGKTHNGDTGDRACDHYHRYKEDIQLMRQMGLKAYRFSVSWPRVIPAGVGSINPKGIEFYDRLTDELLRAGIEPFCTLYHWDLPQALQDRGGWRSPDTARAFADYAGVVASELSDRIKHFMTMNEISSFVNGYRNPRHAPGFFVDDAQWAQLTHYAVLGHGMAVQSIRSTSPADVRIGLAENIVAATPAVESSENIKAAAVAMREENARIMTVILEGRYTSAYLKRLGMAAPKFTAEELLTISSPLDFVGLNIYNPAYVRACDSEQGYKMVPLPASYPHMESPWLSIGPEAMYWTPKLASELWKLRHIYITENGASSSDVLTPEGTVLDIDRVMFLRNYLTHLQRAVRDGVPVRGYFVWSLLDNFEWADGYGKRFGIFYVDFGTQKRIPKMSAEFYRNVIVNDGLG